MKLFLNYLFLGNKSDSVSHRFFLLLAIVTLFVTACGGSGTSTSDGVSSESADKDFTAPYSGTPTPATQMWAGQRFRFERISVEQGLSQSTVFSTLQDSRGIMWFGTQDGLNKYDGYSFTIYKHEPGNPNSLSDNWVWTIHEDHLGALWIGTLSGGLDRLVLSEAEGSDRELDQFTHYPSDPDDPHSLSDNEVLSIYEDRAGLLWIGTRGGLDLFDRKNESFTHYRNDPDDPDTLSSNAVLSLYRRLGGG